MPYASDAQRRYFHAAAARGDIGKKTVNRWDKLSKGMDLPEHVKPKKQEKKAFDLGGPLLNGFVDEIQEIS